jgi:nucleotide-binding universal stress UspA family protein
MTQHSTAQYPTPTASAPARRIVAGVDFSDNAARAAGWAAREAVDRALPLHLVYALDLPDAAGMLVEPSGYADVHRTDGEKLLGELCARLKARYPGLAVTTELSELGAAETLAVLSQDAEMIVTGTRGHGGFSGLLLGSVSLKLAAHAYCPTVVVRGEEPGEPLDEIVLGLEPGQDQAPIRFAFQTAATLGARVRVVRSRQPNYGYSGYYFAVDTVTAESDEAPDMAELLKSAREDYPDVEVSMTVVRGNPVPALIEAARGSRLLVIGAHRHRSPLSVGAGYVVQGLLAHSAAPVAVVPIS